MEGKRGIVGYASPERLPLWHVLLDSLYRRFEEFGERWLEFSLREDLLGDRLWALTPEEIDRIRSQPDYDSTQRALDAIPGSRSE